MFLQNYKTIDHIILFLWHSLSLTFSNLKFSSLKTTLNSQFFMGRTGIPALVSIHYEELQFALCSLIINFSPFRQNLLSKPLFSLPVTSYLLPIHLSHRSLLIIPSGMFSTIFLTMSIIYIIGLSMIIALCIAWPAFIISFYGHSSKHRLDKDFKLSSQLCTHK